MLGPLRHTDQAYLAGLGGAIGLVVILTACLSLYTSTNPGPPLASVAAPTAPANLKDKKGWSDFTSAFLVGGAGGAAVGYLLLANIPVLSSFSILSAG